MLTLKDFNIQVPAGATGEYRTICPFCAAQRKKSRDKDLCINTADLTWYCQHCNRSGCMKSRVYRVPMMPVRSKEYRYIEKFFESRKISKQTYESQGIIECDGKIAFPFKDGEDVINIRYRGKGKTFSSEKDCEMIPYGVNNICEDDLVIVEGEIDYLSMIECGINSVVSVPNGANSNLDCFGKYHEKLEKCRSFIIAVDNDEKGVMLRNQLFVRLGKKKCKTVEWSVGCKDANDVLMKNGKQELINCIANSKFCNIEGLVKASDIKHELKHIMETGLPTGLSTGWLKLDKYYRVLPEKLDVVTGIPGSGKSCFVDALITNLAKLHGFKTLIYSPEGYSIPEHLNRFICRLKKASLDKTHPKYLNEEQLNDGVEFLNEHLFWIDPPIDKMINVDTILSITESIILRHGINGLVIDPWNNLEHVRERNISETEYIGKCLTMLKMFAVRNKIHIWIVAHPTKMQKDSQGKYGVVQPYDISGSSNWWNKVDGAISVKRNYVPEGENRIIPSTDIHIQKVKTSNMGKTGMASLYFYPLSEDYNEVPI